MIYLNNAASTYPKPECVNNALIKNFTNLSSSNRSLSFQDPLKECREIIGDFLNVKSEDIIFTSGCTMALNMAILGFPFELEDEIVISSIEHHALLRPILKQVEKYKLKLHIIPCPEGVFDIYKFQEIMNTCKIRLVAMTYASNVLGNILPITKIAYTAKIKNATMLVDCAQGIGYTNLVMKNIDIAGFPAHKGLYGPTGVGVLYVKEHIKLKPLMTGGTGGDSGKYTIENIKVPSSFEVGTKPVFLIKTMCEGLKWVKLQGVQNIYDKEFTLYKYLLSKLKELDNIIIYGKHEEQHLAIISFNMVNVRCKVIENYLYEKHNIIVRAGFHCSSPTHDTIGTIRLGGTVRISLGYYNTIQDIDNLISALKNYN